MPAKRVGKECQREMKEMNIAIAVNEKFIPYACVMLTSVFENHPETKIQVFVLYGQAEDEVLENFARLAEKYHQTIHLVKIPREWFPAELPHTEEWPMEVYYRLALVNILPREIDRILYLDVDIIVKDSIWEFYTSDFGGNSLCACEDMSALGGGMSQEQRDLFREHIKREDFRYFNSGVLLMNIKKMRENVSLEYFIQTAMSINIAVADQDLLNYVFYGDVKYLDESRYNLFAKIYKSIYGALARLVRSKDHNQA